ncbi:hypothetical protein SAMN05216570_1147 [Dyella sp. OK004]|uniref:Ig-like domain-containing protein n=1 Tax=Dyella sp. OK004 TaxID=1855292 RepID=UPI0008E51B70|nr:Ig-like domain-containing protein [Dyella sp. OK004]SFR95203.1 hypothetical protein SAMN05216570_1147 [Dyella sp. OK004]
MSDTPTKLPAQPIYDSGLSDVYSTEAAASAVPGTPVSIVRADGGEDLGPGYIADGTTTDNVLPRLVGTADILDIGWDDADRWITIMDNGVVVGQVLADHFGNWEYQPSLPLSTGEHHFTAEFSKYPDGLGGSPASAPYTIDVEPASVTMPGPALTEQGELVLHVVSYETNPRGDELHNGDSVGYLHPSLQGTAVAGSWVTIMDGATEVCKVQAGADGRWIIDPRLSEGHHSLSAMFADGTATAPVDFTVNIPLSIVVVYDNLGGSPANQHGQESGGTIAYPGQGFGGKAHPGSVVTLMDGDHELGHAQVDRNGSWVLKLDTDLSPGEHHITVVSADGNEVSQSFDINYVPNPPAHGDVGSLSLNDVLGTGEGELFATDHTHDNAQLSTHGVEATDDSVTNGVQAKMPAITHIYDDADLSQELGRGDTAHSAYPTLRGTGEPNSLVELWDGGKSLGTAQVDGDGNWSFTPTEPLADTTPSTIHFLFVSSDAGASDWFPLFVDTHWSVEEPPMIGHVYDGADSSHEIGSMGTTHDSRVKLEGTAKAGSTVTIYDGHTPIGTAQVDGNGHWVFDTPSLGNGGHTLIVEVDGQSSAQFLIIVQVPVTPPPIIGHVYDADGSHEIGSMGTTHDSHVKLEGTAKAGSTVTIYDGYTPIGTSPVDGQGHWTFDTPSLGNGGHTLIAKVDGQSSTQFLIIVQVPVTPPPMIGHLYDADGSHEIGAMTTTHGSHVKLEGTAKADSIVTIYDRNTPIGTAQVDGNGRWMFDTPELVSGGHTLTVSVDGQSSSQFSFIVQPAYVTPTPEINQVQEHLGTPNYHGELTSGATTADGHPLMAGTGLANSIVTIYDGNALIGTAKVNNAGHWGTTLPDLGDGVHNISVVSADGKASAPFVLVVEHSVAQPTIAYAHDDVGATQGNLASGGTTDDTHATLHGTGAPNSVVTIYDRFVDSAGGSHTGIAGTAEVDGSGRWSFTPNAELEYGTHHFTVAASDSNYSQVFTLVVDLDSWIPNHADTLSLNDVLGTGESDLFAMDHNHDNAQLSVHDVEAVAMNDVAANASATNGASVTAHDVAALNANLVLPHEQMHTHVM